MATLQSRLGDSRYVSFLKTGLCLADLKDGLEDLAKGKSLELQEKVVSRLQLKNNPSWDGLCGNESVIKKRGHNWLIECNGNYCGNCTGYIGEVQNYCSHDFPVGNIYWENTKCSLWPNKDDHWQLAKLFIPNKHPKVPSMTAAETDLAGILSFFENCSLARRCVTDRSNIQKVRDVRNAYMHMSKPKMSEEEFMTDTGLLLDLLNDINSNNKMMDLKVAIWKINKIRTTQFSVKPIHEFIVITNLFNEAEIQNSELQQQVDKLEKDSRHLRTIQKTLGLELEATSKQLQSDAKEMADKFNNMKELVQNSDDMIKVLLKQILEIDKKVKILNRDINRIKFRFHRWHRRNEYLFAVTGGIVGGVFGVVGGPAGIVTGAAVGAGIGVGVGRLFLTDD